MKKLIYFLLFLLCTYNTKAQDSTSIKSPFNIPDLKFKLNEEGSHYLKFSITAQIWNRYNQSNPGTLTEQVASEATFDIGIRRMRMWAIAKPLDWLMVATQFGINNFNSQSARKAGDFFHDAYVELTPIQKKLSFGTGLSAWRGHARYSTPSIASILSMDAPLYQQSTNDVNDQFLRSLNIYAKGQIAKFDYRISIRDPLSLKGTKYDSNELGSDAIYNNQGSKLISSAYVKYQFFDEESNMMPYTTGSYLGSKKVLALGMGFEAQPRATVNLNTAGDTVYHAMVLASADIFLDMPVNKTNDDALSYYGAYSYTDFGPKYIRNVGAMNPSTDVNALQSSFNGAGNAYPLIGSGHTIYNQMAYKLPSRWFGERGITIQAYMDMQASNFEKLNDWMTCYNAGLNFLLVGHKAKLTLNYQNRPIFSNTDFTQIKRNNALILQWQVAI